MSSNTVDVMDNATVSRGKLLIHVAQNGHSFELDCDESTTVEVVQNFMESMAGIPLNDQLLLCSDMKLEPHEPLSSYKLPSDDQEVFCFNKARLQANAPSPPLEQLDIHGIAEPPSPSRSSVNSTPHPLDDALDPALKALPSYERQFRYHYHCGNAIYNGTLVKFENCRRLLREQKVQDRAMEIARRNLDQYFKILHQNYMDFLKCFSQQHRVHSDLLANFKRDVEKLKSCKLIPDLQNPTRKCLLDLLKEDNLQKWAENCSNSHKQFENKVSQFKHVFGRLRQDVDDLFSSKANLPIRDLEGRIKEHHRYLDEERSIMLSLSKDVTTVKNLVDNLVGECSEHQLSSSLRPHDAVSALGPMYDVHEKNHLPKMRACDRPISDLLHLCRNKKNEMNSFVQSYLQKTAYIQHSIKDVRLQFNAFSEAMKRQDVVFESLRLVRGLGSAYRACLAEVVRRKASLKLYMGMAGQMAEKLATKREIEMRRREEFLKAQTPYIPRDILGSMGLFDTPSQCDVNIVPFDTNLLDIDIGDVDRYAPEYLVGLPFKSEKQQQPRSSSSVSNESLLSYEAEQNAVDALETYQSQELLDGCDLAEIAGTSQMEVENARLKAELASAIARICSISPDYEYASRDDSKLDSVLKIAAEKTTQALELKDEYVKHLEFMLRENHMKCDSYEKRIQELEQKLADQYSQGRRSSDNPDAMYSAKVDDCKSDISTLRETQMPYSSSEPMDEVSCASNPLDAKLGLFPRMTSKAQEGVDENMADSSGSLNPQLFMAMLPQHEEQQFGSKDVAKKMVMQLDVMPPNNVSAAGTTDTFDALPPEAPAKPTFNSNVDENHVLELQSALDEKTKMLLETESRLESAMNDVSMLGKELEGCRKLLDESQMNCAHLENCLHEAREEAQTHLCAADRRASEYSALRASAVKIRSLFKRLSSCVTASSGVAGFAESLHTLAQSLANSANDGEDDGAAEFRICVRILADKVGNLVKSRAELLDRYPKTEAANKSLTMELEKKKELINTLYTKLQLEKQASKEKISFWHFEVHEIAAFVLNPAGHYEAINRSCSNYYLSSESVALFTEQLSIQPLYIIGQIVHIERLIVKSPPTRSDQVDIVTNRLALNTGPISNPYGLPVGCEYFIVTVAMLPDTAVHPTPAS